MGEPLRRLCVWVTLHDTLVQYAACLAPLAFGLGERYHSIPIILTRTTLHFSFFQVSLLFFYPPGVLTLSCGGRAMERNVFFNKDTANL